MFYVVRSGKYHGPFSREQIVRLRASGKIDTHKGDRVVAEPINKLATPRTRRKRGDSLDIHFNHMISVQVATVLWVICLIWGAFVLVGGEAITIWMCMSDPINVLMLPVWPILVLVIGLVVRLWLEFMVVIFKIAEHTRRIK